MAKDPKIEIILDYLQDEFPEFTIGQNGEDTRGYTFDLRNQDETHLVTIQEDFINQHDALEIRARLVDYRLASVMRDIGEFQVLVTDSGCIFA